MRYAAAPSSDDRRPKNLLSVFGFPCAMIDDFCRLAPSLAGVASRHRKVGPSSSSSPSAADSGRKEDFSNWLLAVTTNGRREEGKRCRTRTARTHAYLHGHRRQNRDRRERASERAKGRVSAPAIFDHAAAPGRRRDGGRDGRTSGRPLAQVIRLPPSPRCTSIRQSCPDGVRRETSTCGDCARTEADFSECHSPPRRSFPLPDFLCGRKDGPVSDPHRAKK